jgi:hypothetical protein
MHDADGGVLGLVVLDESGGIVVMLSVTMVCENGWVGRVVNG